MIDVIMTLIPPHLLVVLAILAAVHRWYVTKWNVSIISRWENVLYAIALSNIAVFYIGIDFGWWENNAAIALSRLVWAWLLLVSLYISHRMAKRHR